MDGTWGARGWQGGRSGGGKGESRQMCVGRVCFLGGFALGLLGLGVGWGVGLGVGVGGGRQELGLTRVRSPVTRTAWPGGSWRVYETREREEMLSA